MASVKHNSTNAYMYQNLYPVNLYVTLSSDWDDAVNFFDFYGTTDALDRREAGEPKWLDATAAASTYLVVEKQSRNIGVLIVLQNTSCPTLAHEAIHYADAVYEMLSMNAEGYNAGNEQYAYLVSWCVEKLEDFVKCKKKQRRGEKMTRKTTKLDGS